LKIIRLRSEEHQRPEGSEPLDPPEEGSNPLFQNNSSMLSFETIRRTFPKEDLQDAHFWKSGSLTPTPNPQPRPIGC